MVSRSAADVVPRGDDIQNCVLVPFYGINSWMFSVVEEGISFLLRWAYSSSFLAKKPFLDAHFVWSRSI